MYDQETAPYGIQKVCQLFADCKKIIPEVLEACLDYGFFTVEDVADAAETLQKKQLELEAQAAAELKKAEDERAESLKAPNKFASLFNDRNANPETFIEYIKSRPIKELAYYLNNLKEKPQWHAQFYTDGICSVISDLERIIEEKKGEHA